MANAGCINAYDCNGCLIQTLQNLDSACIGVGVQYTAPNPLNDKRLDYIKYTDKCGCTCCLSGENEILIYATDGVIKNLTLTNDDVNEAIKIQWNDIFGSNRAKTIVRYKTGSYPVSITDGTLAVEETTKNQYSSTPFSLSGVLDETTYYISAFAVDSNGTIIDVQSSSIQTDFFFAKYQKVEYVQSYGDQYIQTDIQAGNTKGAYMKVLCTNVYDDNIWFGASGSGDTRQVIGAQEKKIYLGWNAKSYTGISANTVYEAGLNYLNSRKATLNGNNVSNLGTLSSSNVYKFAIFGGNYLGTINPLKATIKLYELKLSEGTAITHDFVPVYRKSDSVIGMLDITNKVFYTNNGTGTFGKGSDVPR